MNRDRALFLIAVFAVLFIFCDKGDKYDLRTFFPGPGFKKGWSWDKMPVEYKHSDIVMGKAGEAARILSDKIAKIGKATYFWGNYKDSSFTVIIYKFKIDSIAKVLSDSILAYNPGIDFKDDSGRVISPILNGQYLIAIKSKFKSQPMLFAVKRVVEKLNLNINK